MDIRPALVADAKAPVLVHPGQRPLDRPAGRPQPALIVDPRLGPDRLDPHLPQSLAVRLGIVGQVPLHRIGPVCLGWPTLPPTGGILWNRGANSDTSLRLAGVTDEASGMPQASVIRWCLLPGLDRSTGLGPVASPP